MSGELLATRGGERKDPLVLTGLLRTEGPGGDQTQSDTSQDDTAVAETSGGEAFFRIRRRPWDDFEKDKRKDFGATFEAFGHITGQFTVTGLGTVGQVPLQLVPTLWTATKRPEQVDQEITPIFGPVNGFAMIDSKSL
jgi:hypothetical protein